MVCLGLDLILLVLTSTLYEAEHFLMDPFRSPYNVLGHTCSINHLVKLRLILSSLIIAFE